MSARFAPLIAKLGTRLHLAATKRKARSYLIEDISSGIEIRRYESRIAAEVATPVKNAISGEDEAFWILAGYVFGANQVRNKLSVLTPIEVTGRSERMFSSFRRVSSFFARDIWPPLNWWMSFSGDSFAIAVELDLPTPQWP